MIEIKGKGGISAKIIADSVADHETSSGVRIVTYELVYPRFIHSEFMTHRMLSKNAASSRAIPVEKNIEHIRANTAMPIHWGKNQPGMSAKEECNTRITAPRSDVDNWTYSREEVWNMARDSAIACAQMLHETGYHKQIVNRLLEPFTFIKVVCTGTEFANLFHLRCHPDAQPEFQELARCMKEAYDKHHSIVLEPGEWHVPYYRSGFWSRQNTAHYVEEHPLEDALKMSISRCAQVSYRKEDDSIEKANKIVGMLFPVDSPKHLSPFEHQATPINYNEVDEIGWTDVEGISHEDTEMNLWSGNLKGWIQLRKLIESCGEASSMFDVVLKHNL